MNSRYIPTYEAVVLFNQQRHPFTIHDPADGLVEVHRMTVKADDPADACEKCWIHCQTIDRQWKPDTRSMAVGDVVLLRPLTSQMPVTVWQAAAMGFNRVAVL